MVVHTKAASRITRQPAAPQTAEEAALRDIERNLPALPRSVHGVTFRLGENWQGEPAMWIVVQADDDLKPSKKKLETLQAFTDEIRQLIFASGITRWPYVDIETK